MNHSYVCDWCGEVISDYEHSVYTVLHHMHLHHPYHGHSCLAEYQKVLDDCNERKRNESLDFVVGPSTD